MSVPTQTSFDRVRETAGRRGWLAVKVFGLVFALAAGVALGIPPVYRATSTVLVGAEEGIADGGSPAELEGRLHVVKEEILSRAHAAGLVSRFGLYPDLQKQGAKELVLSQFRRDVEVQLREALEPGGRGRTVAVAIAYRGPDPGVVAGVTNALAEAYLSWHGKLRSQEAAAIEVQLAQVRAQVDEQERRLGEFRVRPTGEAPYAGGGDSGMATLERLQGQLRSVSEGRMRALERRSTLLRDLGEAAPRPPDDPDATASRLAKLNQELGEARQKYTDKYPDVLRIKRDIATLERQAAESRRQSRPAPAAPRCRKPCARRTRRSTRCAGRSRSSSGRWRATGARWPRRRASIAAPPPPSPCWSWRGTTRRPSPSTRPCSAATRGRGWPPPRARRRCASWSRPRRPSFRSSPTACGC
jgi:polysaccharide biosynthesis transport protein